jgi:IS30 family transposase
MAKDNGLTFAAHEAVNEKLNNRSFFIHPYTSKEKGTLENRIGVL